MSQRTYFCYCCGQHLQTEECGMCKGSGCYRCLEWMYECYHLGDTWCRDMHRPMKQCRHPITVVAHQLRLEV